MPTKRIVCLANSRKHSGRCIAGKERLDHGYGGWVRPISARQTAEISEEERRYQDGTYPRLLDVIDIPVVAPSPSTYQSENYLINERYYWRKAGSASRGDLPSLIDHDVPLWTDGDSTYNGHNDRVGVAEALEFSYSLVLVRPDTLKVVVAEEGREFGNPRRRVRAEFDHLGSMYNLVVTDPTAERDFLGAADGTHVLTNVYVCVSLGEAHTDGYCYKLAAGIIRG